jgi:2-dehydropantoate 2-reductase
LIQSDGAAARGDSNPAVYVLGVGAVGAPLAAFLTLEGRKVIAVHTSRDDAAGDLTITVRNGADRVAVPVETAALSTLRALDGIVVVAAKSHANAAIAESLKGKGVRGPLVIMQNGLGIEKVFLDSGFPRICRCILYVTGQRTPEGEYSFRSIAPSLIGVVRGDRSELTPIVESLATSRFPFRAEQDLERQVWKKAIVNSVFNSICPLLDVDNGVFVRDGEAAALAMEVIRECTALAARLDISLTEDELREQVMLVSKGSDGQLISTLQDLRSGARTEIESFNLELARIASSLVPPVPLHRTELLGRLIRARSLRTLRGERLPA